ncbi:hypothetical protein LINGRAHAP2_LOCUS1746 [Linum grandiflorum]
MDHLTKWSITQPFGLRLAHRQRLWIRDNEGNLLGSSSEVGYSRENSTAYRFMKMSDRSMCEHRDAEFFEGIFPCKTQPVTEPVRESPKR